MRKLLLSIMIFSSLVLLIACGSNDSSNSSGKELSQKNCEGCHGDEIKERGLSKSEILSAIKHGASGMSANILKGNDAEKVAEYLAKQ